MNTPQPLEYFSVNKLSTVLINFRSHFAFNARKTMYDLFMKVFSPNEITKVLDVGVTPDQSLKDSNFFEQLYPWTHSLTAVSIENAQILETIFSGLKFIQIDGRNLPFKDNEFDIIFCSAVIEHVGTREQQQAFVKESLRVAKKFFFTTPNKNFPLEFHTMLPFIHWFPQSFHQKILRFLGYEFLSKTENLNLLSEDSLLEIFSSPYKYKNIQIYRYHLLGLSSNLVIYGEKE
jgi:SAM-dependent methyltransferase